MSPMIKRLMVLVIIVLVGAVVYLGVSYTTLRSELRRNNQLIINKSNNEKTVIFLQMFIKDVLKSTTQVDFETRLKLENAVRAVNDKNILTQWQKFVSSKNEVEAQMNTKDLLEMLAQKIIINN